MPICKNCKKRIDRFNKDRCPICGVEKPFEGMSSDTVEITTNIDTEKYSADYHPCKKTTFLFWSVVLGFTGVQFFYLHFKKIGVFHLITNLCVLAALIVTFTLVLKIFIVFSILLAIGIIYFLNACIGLAVYSHPNLKDGRGEFTV